MSEAAAELIQLSTLKSKGLHLVLSRPAVSGILVIAFLVSCTKYLLRALCCKGCKHVASFPAANPRKGEFLERQERNDTLARRTSLNAVIAPDVNTYGLWKSALE